MKRLILNGIKLGVLTLMLAFGLISTPAMAVQDAGVLIAAGGSGSSSGSGSSTGSSSGGGTCSGGNFLGFIPWYSGLQCDANGAISESNFSSGSGTDAQNIATFVWKIGLNVLSDISLAVGYVALGMVIYSGFLILTSQGEAERMAKGRKTLIATGVGAAIAILATIAIRVIIGVIS